jgi:2-polyprenyl-3-methyl-5-hydroxy-6-metoxy-1,4-benzoquinol methylase
MESMTVVAPEAEFALALEVGRVQRAVAAHFERRPSSMLDVGCGYRRPSGLLADHVVGFDPDETAVATNPCIDERVVGSIDTVPLPAETYEVVVAWNVLEHVEDPAVSLARIARTVVQDGVLVLAFPNVSSMRGRITKHTPTWFHRTVIRGALRGQGAQPHATFMPGSLDVSSVVENLEALGFRTLHLSRYEGYHEMRLKEIHPVLGGAWIGLTRFLSTVSRGRLDHRSDVMGAFVRT